MIQTKITSVQAIDGYWAVVTVAYFVFVNEQCDFFISTYQCLGILNDEVSAFEFHSFDSFASTELISAHRILSISRNELLLNEQWEMSIGLGNVRKYMRQVKWSKCMGKKKQLQPYSIRSSEEKKIGWSAYSAIYEV